MAAQINNILHKDLSPAPAAIMCVCKKLDECRNIIDQDIPNAGESSTLRWKIYSLLQSQDSDGNGAIYKELRCSIHLGLLGENGDPLTLPCGHTYCRECIKPIIVSQNKICPDCRTPIHISLEELRTNVSIKAIVDRLIPRQIRHN